MQHAKPRNTGVHCEGVKGATADFVCFHCPSSPPQRRNPCIAKNKLRIINCQQHKPTKHPPKKQGCASHAPLLFVSKDCLLLPNRVEFLRQAPLGRRFTLAPFCFLNFCNFSANVISCISFLYIYVLL